MTYKLIIFDLDGTLARPYSGATFRQRLDNGMMEDYVPLPGRKERIDKLRDEGVHVAIATNQGGIAYNIMSYHEVNDDVHLIAWQLGIGYYQICPHHPKGTVSQFAIECYCRKPKPGMLVATMEFMAVTPADTLMVGDRDEDKGAAEAAGVAFQWADEFFS